MLDQIISHANAHIALNGCEQHRPSWNLLKTAAAWHKNHGKVCHKYTCDEYWTLVRDAHALAVPLAGNCVAAPPTLLVAELNHVDPYEAVHRVAAGDKRLVRDVRPLGSCANGDWLATKPEGKTKTAKELLLEILARARTQLGAATDQDYRNRWATILCEASQCLAVQPDHGVDFDGGYSHGEKTCALLYDDIERAHGHVHGTISLTALDQAIYELNHVDVH
jgi:hypothetical protein